VTVDGVAAVDVLVVGSANMDLLMRVTALPGTGETVLGRDAAMAAGGKGANQAAAAALAGARVRMAGRVGDDGHGATVRDALADAGVDVSRLDVVAGAPTGLAVVLVDADGDNAIAVAPGANHALTVADVEALREDIRAAGLVLLQLELPVDAVAHVAAVAAQERTVVLLNLAPATEVPAALLEATDVLVMNRAEAESLVGGPLPDTGALRRAAGELLERGPSAVVVTAGGDGAVLGDADGIIDVPALPAEVVDTAGAGDAFVGVLAAEISRGRSVRDALEPAMAAGAAAVSVQGARLKHLPSRPGRRPVEQR
jgi:ribokinase